MKLSKSLVLTALLTWFSAMPALAEQKKQLGPWDVHYIALPTTVLDADIAAQYKIERSKFNGLLNISVLTSKDQQAQQVTLVGESKNLLGQIKPLNFVEVKEGASVYYLAQYGFKAEEFVTFTITITQGSQSQRLQFNHTFYVD